MTALSDKPLCLPPPIPVSVLFSPGWPCSTTISLPLSISVDNQFQQDPLSGAHSSVLLSVLLLSMKWLLPSFEPYVLCFISRHLLHPLFCAALLYESYIFKICAGKNSLWFIRVFPRGGEKDLRRLSGVYRKRIEIRDGWEKARPRDLSVTHEQYLAWVLEQGGVLWSPRWRCCLSL